jgi:hypothetical protein
MDTEAPSKRKTGSGWWPEVDSSDGAKGAAHQGAGSAVIVAGVTTLFSVLAIFGVQILPGFSPASLIDAGLFAIVAWRIYKMSRIWAVLGLVFFVGERVYSLYLRGLTGAGGLVVGVILLFGFISGVRGTFAYQKLSKVPAVE